MGLIFWLFLQIEPQAKIQGGHIEVHGTSTLPDGTVVVIQVYGHERELVRESVQVKEGAFLSIFCLADRLPKATYRVRVSFGLDSQARVATVEKLKALGLEKDVRWERVLSHGTKDEQIEEYRSACRALEKRVDAIVQGVEGFFLLMLEPPETWKESQARAMELIRRPCRADELEFRVFGLDEFAQSAVADLAHQAEQAILLRAKAEADGGLSAALERAARVRRMAHAVRERLAPAVLKRAEIEEKIEDLESCGGDSERAAPILLELAHVLASAHYARLAEIGELIARNDPSLKRALADFLSSLE